MTDQTAEKPAGTSLITSAAALPAALAAKMSDAKFRDDFGAQDLFLPWLQRVQSTSGYIKRGNAEYIADAREGDIIDNLTKRLRATQAVIFVKFERHFTTFAPGGGKVIKQWFLDRSGYDAADFPEGKDFGKKADAAGNEVQETPLYYVLMLDMETGAAQPATMGWGSTQAKKVKKVNSLAREQLIIGGQVIIPPIYSRIFEIGTNIETGNDKSWAGWTYKVAGLTLGHPQFGEAWWAQAEAFRKQIDDGNVRPAAPADQAAAGDDGAETYEGGVRRGGTSRGNGQVTDVEADKLDSDIPF